MIRSSTPWVLSAALALCLGACGGDDEGTSGGGTDSTTGGSTTDASTSGSTGSTSTTNGTTAATTDASTSTTTDGSGSTTDTTAGTTGGGMVEAFRITELYVREPHFYGELLGFQCTDVTDLDTMLGKGVNPSFNEAMSTDMDDAMGSGTPDGVLDLSFVMLFDPLDQAGGGSYDFQRADCLVPASMTICSPTDGATVSTFDYTSMANATCLEPDPAHLTNMYTPKPNAVSGACFASTSAALVLELGDIQLPLTDAEVAATYDADPADNLTPGLIKGFVSETDAQNVVLPQDIQDVTGATVLADLLPGSPSNCANHDDRDDNDGTSGWWFYVDFVAERVPWTP